MCASTATSESREAVQPISVATAGDGILYKIRINREAHRKTVTVHTIKNFETLEGRGATYTLKVVKEEDKGVLSPALRKKFKRHHDEERPRAARITRRPEEGTSNGDYGNLESQGVQIMHKC